MTKGINDLQPERLKQALVARGLTKGELAALVGVVASTVTKWCQGDQFPEPQTFEKLAFILNVKPEWLTRPMLQSVSPPLYRSNAATLKSARAKLEANVGLVQEIAALLSNYVDYPKLNLPEYIFRSPEQISTEDIEDAADKCRSMWQLGRVPIQNLVLAAEGAGIIIVRQETEIPAIEGLSTWSNLLSLPIVFLSSDKANAFRSRFDLAHEIGHLVLHKYIECERGRDPNLYKLMEKQAHHFAGALLLPAETFASEISIPPSLNNLLVLKQRWGVSVAAMVMRLDALGLISEDKKNSLFKNRSARWGSKSEPGDDGREPEIPRLLRRTIDLLINEGVLSAQDIPRYIGLSEKDIEKICHLRDSYFSNCQNIIEIENLRGNKILNLGKPMDSIQSANVISFSRFKK